MTRDPQSAPPLRLTGAGVVLGGEAVLQNVDFTVSAGQFVAVLGANGSGKSTLLRALLGLQPLSQGSVELFGAPPRRFRQWPRIAYVPQQLFAAGAVPVSVREVVLAGLISPATRFRPQLDRDRERDSLHRSGLWGRRSDAFHHLSGGQQRRVMIAAAMAKGADLLVLDEPTAGVDAESAVALRGTLAEVSARGVTVILVSHELGVMTDLVTRCLVLGRRPGGSVLYDGPPPPPETLRDVSGHHEARRPGEDEIWGGGL